MELEKQREDFYAEIDLLNLKPLWTVLKQLLTPKPETEVRPYLWQWTKTRPHLLRSTELVTAQEAERRVLYLANPGLKDGPPATTQTLYAGLQIIRPGEIAPAHRHSPAALRFIVEGTGAYTRVNGEKTLMNPGDLVLTANWTWHEHGNQMDSPVIWLDCLDIPLTGYLNQVFFEKGTEAGVPDRPVDISVAKYGAGLTPRFGRHEEPFSPLINYKFDKVYAALQSMSKQGESNPYDDLIFEYTNPLSGGPITPTMSAFVQLIRPGQKTAAHRHTSSVVYQVIRGQGTTEIDGKEFPWHDHDVFVIPTWAKHRHVNTSADDEALLFSFSDEAAIRSLGLYREESE